MRSLRSLLCVVTLLALFSGAISQTCASLDPQPVCPFATWRAGNNSDVRNCFECKWCPFRRETCCEIADEVSILEQIDVSGADYWDCFITIMHFQECGRCSPESRKFTCNGKVDYIGTKNTPDEAKGFSIRVCKQACGYIYDQCKDAKLLSTSQPFTTKSKDDFCKDAPADDSPDCYNSALRSGARWTVIAALAAFLLAFLA
eukprot:TRINITY_DN4360_c0_g2_i1.p1 TRINITY_DN4360_c0_g2~~TRINITY_DN4360_c0_g2_i1.p1  ORF type:complete len:210 (-),score=35.03 TRINITY_DN4360_c0_g2_i1:63-668(-)